MDFIEATNNAGKMKEFRRILTALGHTVQSQREAGINVEPEENGTTSAANARIKAEAICAVCGKPTIADDSGLCVEALGGAPGVYSARYCGHHGDDEANNDKLLADMQPFADKAQRGAKFVSAICVYLPNGRHFTFMGECPGWVGFARKGTNGFGYDPIFNTEKYDNRSYAQLTDAEKDTISHRGMALASMQQHLPQLLADTTVLGATTGVCQIEIKE